MVQKKPREARESTTKFKAVPPTEPRWKPKPPPDSTAFARGDLTPPAIKGKPPKDP